MKAIMLKTFKSEGINRWPIKLIKKKTNGSVLAGLFKELGGIKGIFSHILKTVNGNQVSKGNCQADSWIAFKPTIGDCNC